MYIDSSPSQRVRAALRGERPGKIPFTVYENMLHRCSIERELRNRGTCIVKRIASYRLVTPNVQQREIHYNDENGRKVIKTIITTPVGELSKLRVPMGATTWQPGGICVSNREYMFKTKDDYKVLDFIINDTKVLPNYDKTSKMGGELGDDFILIDSMSIPMQSLIISYMGMEHFCLEWMDNRDEVLKLMQSLWELCSKINIVVANGPLEHAICAGNIVPSIIGLENFRKYYMPAYNEAAHEMHKRGKLIGSHLDADNTHIMEDICCTDLDFIEAYDAGMSPPVKKAREIWKNKVLWLNWPSSWHLESEDKIKELTKQIIEEAEPVNGFLIGITEDVPEYRWQENFTLIMDAIDEYEEKQL